MIAFLAAIGGFTIVAFAVFGLCTAVYLMCR